MSSNTLYVKVIQTVTVASHFLLTALGTKHRITSYELNENVVTAELSPIALMKLLPEDERPEKMLVLCTDAAKRSTYPTLAEASQTECIPLDIPEGLDAQEIQQIMRTILKNVPDGSDLTLDLTHGLRHFPFLFFTAVLYLSALKDVRIRGAWYGMLEATDASGNAPFVDLSILLEMTDWFQAVRTFKGLKNARPLIEMLRRNIDEWSPVDTTGTNGKNDLETFVKYIEKFNFNYGAGLPVELGKSAFSIEDVYTNKLMTFLKSELHSPSIPMSSELMEHVVNSAKPFTFHESPSSGGNWKQSVAINDDELMRQASLVDSYLESGLINNAIGLMREFVVSRAAFQHKDANTDSSWLERERRKQAERKLGALLNYSTNHSKNPNCGLTGCNKELARCWDSITQHRNELHHHGMKKEVVKIDSSVSELKDVWQTMKEKLHDDEFWDPEFGGGSGRLLITPLGLSPGLLFTALKTAIPPPDVCLVLTSKEGERNLEEVLGKTGYTGEIRTILMTNPQDGFEEVPSITKECDELLVKADEIVCNVTGGTTAMQWAISSFFERAKKLSRDVRRVAMVDRRSHEEQKKNPYMKGEMVELDGGRKEDI